MADTVPRHNQNTVDLRALLSDSVSGADNGIQASTDGTHFSAAALNGYLARAYAWLPSLLLRQMKGDEVAKLMPLLIKNHEFSPSSSGTTIKKDRIRIHAVRKSGSTNIYQQITHSQFYDDRDYFLNNVFYEFEGKIFIAERASGTLTILNSNLALMEYEYFKAERVDETTGSFASPNTQCNNQDITLDIEWHPVCVRYAAMLACLDKGGAEWQNQAQSFKESVKLLLPQGIVF